MMKEPEINNDKKIAIIYSIDDLFSYMVKICYQGDSYYVGNNDHPEKFGNMEEAKNACRKRHVEEVYLALSNAYQEFDATTDDPLNPMPRYDYQKVFL